VEIRGLATGSRELDVLSPYHLMDRVNALVLSGGSAFGLAAADGVMDWLSEAGLGFETGVGPVPLVPAAVIFDLAPGVPRPDAALGRRACQAATDAPVAEGSVGAGAGASLGKAMGPSGASKGGVGSASVAWLDHTVGALAVVNALGDVVGEDGSTLAGARGPTGAVVTADHFLADAEGTGGFPGHPSGPRVGENTSLLVVGTDAPVSRLDLGRLARMAAAAFPRALSPVNTPFDGDIVFALSSAPAESPSDLPPAKLLSLGIRARQVAETAIRRGGTVSG
jgi:L-aminopeptidase/D-esterase-like protein